MLNNFQLTDILATTAVLISITLLIYFAVKTLITSNFFQKGINLYQQKDYQGAEAAFRRVIAINSTNDVVRLFLGDTLREQGRVAEATDLFQEVISRNPKNPQGYLRLATILMEQDKQAEAKTNLQQAQELLQKQRQPETAKKIARLLEQMETKSN
ncbi:tetratricopeptide repeat protein [Nostoc sp. MS1]|uniref:tetratricopeptide repeat protein n=1 Tax=Nostoc sp. MS1 TaxID=2764711 RepID=UPI001CC82FB3|nr:tetratricopeptide repeat protein [Nostoc sp. MS1]BCL34924.1 hypothetical protein NSMS1_13710 [Nostoc sp. MS1]